MADSTTHLDQINGNVLQREVIFNELMDAMSPALTGGRRAAKCAGLNFAFYTARYRDLIGYNSFTLFKLDANATNYITMERATGSITHDTSTEFWDDDDHYMRIYKVVTGDAEVESYEDHRSMIARVL